jgi:hypothetical protein
MKKYYKIDIKGRIPAGTIKGISFHPRLFYGTEKEFDTIVTELYRHEDCFKVLGWHSFNTLDEYIAKFPWVKNIEDYV